MQHDLAHHFAGIPGIRQYHLKDKEKTKKLIVDIILKKEVFATAVSSIYYVPKYWEWRDKPQNVSEYRKYAQGYYSGVAPMTNREHVQVLHHYIYGQTKKYISFLRSKLSTASLQRTKDLGVPRAIPDLSSLLGDKLDSMLMSTATTYIEPIHSIYRKVGYKKFIAYSEALADMMMTDWYVKWSEDFKIGIPLEDLHLRSDHLLDQIRNDQIIKNPPIGNINHLKSWEQNLLKTEMSLLGRRINEVLQMADKGEDLSSLKQVYEDLVRNYDDLFNGEFQKAKKQYVKILNRLEKNFPLDKYVSWSARPRGASFKDFWKNPYGIVWSRGDDLSNANLPRLSPKYLQSQYYTRRKNPTRRVEKLQENVYTAYEAFLENKLNETKIYSQDFPGYQKALNDFISDSFLPQLPYLAIKKKSKKEIEDKMLDILSSWNQIQLNEVPKSFEKNKIFQEVESIAKEIYSLMSHHKRKIGLTERMFLEFDYNNLLKKLDSFEYFLKEKNFLSSKKIPSVKFIYTSPPSKGYRVGEFVDILSLKLDVESPKVFPLRYESIADWISTNEIENCNKYLSR